MLNKTILQFLPFPRLLFDFFVNDYLPDRNQRNCIVLLAQCPCNCPFSGKLSQGLVGWTLQGYLSRTQALIVFLYVDVKFIISGSSYTTVPDRLPILDVRFTYHNSRRLANNSIWST